MTCLDSLLADRNLAPFLPKAEMLEILQREEYGFLPPKPEQCSFEVLESDESFCNGKAIFQKISANCTIKGNPFSFPFYSVMPCGDGRFSLVVHLKFGENVSDKFMPSEELAEKGFACLSFCYEKVTSDDNDMTNGLAGVLYPDGQRGDTDPGKIAMWAWAAQRLMDYAQTLPQVNWKKSIICGHSRLGKTALLAGAADERFALVYSNNSGCSGAALFNDKVGESVEAITKNFPYWFCKNFLKYKDRDTVKPFDQHYLTACVAPRNVYIASAAEDTWADPTSEFLNFVAVGKYYEKLGLTAFVCPEKIPQATTLLQNENVAYHIRAGEHCFTHEDWEYLLEYANRIFETKSTQ